MKKKYLSLLLLGALGSSLSDRTYAQGYEPLLVSSGFTADVIANGTGTAVSKTSAAVDDASAPGAGFAYVSRDYLLDAAATPLTYGLPANGIMGSLVSATSGMQFRLHNYDANNSLRLAAQNDAGTLTFSNTLAAKKIFIAATTGSGSATVTVRVTFTDATFVDVTGLTIADWYGGSNAIIQGIGRINRANSALEANTTNPRIYQVAVDIPVADQSKLVQSITVTKTSSAVGIVNVFGATADLSGITCDMPTAVTSSPTSPANANISWTAATGALSYEYAYSTNNIMPAMSTSGTAATGTSASISGLTTNTTYYVWVRSVCGAGNKSAWTATTSFTTPLATARPWLEAFFVTGTPSGFTTTNWTIGSTRGVTGNPGNNIYRRMNNSTLYNFSTISVGTIQAGDIFTFDYKHPNYASPYDAPAAGAGYFKVSVSTDFGATYTQIDSVPVDANNTWNTKNYPMGAYVGNYVKIKIDAGRSSGDWDLAFDNLYIGAPITCVMPLNPVASGITHNSAIIDWTAPATAPANGYEYYYSTTNTAPTAATTASGTTGAGITTANIGGLNSNTTYYVWVRSVCGPTDKSMWSNSGSFTTMLVLPRPWTEGFASTNTPAGFNISGWTVGSTRGVTGNPGNNLYRNLYSLATTGTFSTVNVGPIIAGDVFSFDFKTSLYSSPYAALNAGSGYYKISVSTDYGTTYTQIDSVATPTVNTWISKIYPLTAFVGQIVKIKIDATWSAQDYDMAFDNLYVGAPPSCFLPTALTSNTITNTTANIAWTAPSTAPANGYEYYYSTSNTAPTAATVASGATAAGVTTAGLSILTANTTYYFWVRSVCGAANKSDWTAVPGSFTTQLVLPRPWTEGFTTTNTPAGFNISGWTIGSTRGVTGNPGNNLYKNLYSSAATGTFTTVNVGAVVAGDVFSFDFKTSLYSSPYDALTAGSGYYKVFVSTDYGATYTQIDSVATPTVNTWIYRSYPLSAYAGQNVKMKVDATWSAQDFDLAFDNLYIGAPPTCFVPTSLGSNTVTTATANITWAPPAQAAPANGYEYYYSTSNTAPTAATAANGATGAGVTTAALSTLTANTTYYFWVRSVCGATDKSDWTSAPGSFYTGYCLPVATSSSTYFNGVTSSAGITNLNNPATGFTTGGYADYFNTQTLTAAAGSTVQVSFNIVGGTAGVSMFVDMNNDLIFSAAERVYTSSAYLATGAHTVNVTIPAGSAPGTYRARIITDFNSTTPSPCGFGSGRGEAEDYKIIVPNCTLPVVNLGNDTAICAGASLTLNAGNAGATYAWSNGATTQSTSITAAGTYHVTVTNGVCAKSDTIVVSVTPNPVVNLGNDTTICTGSTLTLNAGNAGATYAWSNGATTQTINVTTAGSYHVAVTNGNCTGNDTIVVSVSPNPIVDLGIDTTICDGAILTLNAGNTGATYVWSDASTNATLDVTASGTYHVAVTNAAGCTATDTIDVAVAALPVVSLGNDTAICEGETLTLDATGAATDTYLWSDQSTNPTLDVTTAGVYHVTITNGSGCTAADTIEVEIDPLPSADDITVTGTSPNFSFAVTNGTDIDSYEWNFGDGQTSTQEDPTHVYATSGTAQTMDVSVVISNDCGSDTLYTQVTVEPVSVRTLSLDANALKLYPNPTAHNVTIENVSQFKMKQVTITNILGQKVGAMPITGTKQTLDVSNLTSGSYHVRIEFEEGAVVRKLEILK